MPYKIIVVVLIIFNTVTANNNRSSNNITKGNAYNNLEKPLNTYKKIWKKAGVFKALSRLVIYTENKATTRVRAAVHEAGHIVIGKNLNIKIIKSSLKKSYTINNKISSNQNKNKIPVEGFTSYITSDNKLESKIKLSLAGYMAELVILGKVGDYCNTDLNTATQKTMALHKLTEKDEKKIRNKLNYYIEETKNIVSNNIEIILRFKKELLDQEELNQDKIDLIYSEELST